MLKLATGAPLGVKRTSASRPRLPTRMTLLTLPIVSSSFRNTAGRGGECRSGSGGTIAAGPG